MTTDLQAQRNFAEMLVEVLNDFIEPYPVLDDPESEGEMSYELDAAAVLDALGCCGLTLQPGNDAGMAFIDGLISKAHNS